MFDVFQKQLCGAYRTRGKQSLIAATNDASRSQASNLIIQTGSNKDGKNRNVENARDSPRIDFA